MSVSQKFELFKLKYKSNANFNVIFDYCEEVNSSLGGGVGDIFAEDIKTSDLSNVQLKLDSHQFSINENTNEILNLKSEIAQGLPAVSVADNRSSIIISDLADTTFMNFINLNLNQNSADFFNFSGDTFNILKAGVYNINVFVNANKTGGGTGDLLCKVLINNILPINFSRIVDITSDSKSIIGISGLILINSDNSNLKINFQNLGTGTYTATTDSNNEAFIFQIFKI